MKKIIIGILGLVLISLFAVGVLGKTDVVGVVYEADHETPVSGADVHVECYNLLDELTVQADTTTDSDGTYAVEFGEIGDNKCTNDYKVVVTAEKGSASGVNEGIVKDYGVEVKLAIINVAIPEFTLITAGIALTGALLGLSIFRKHRRG